MLAVIITSPFLSHDRWSAIRGSPQIRCTLMGSLLLIIFVPGSLLAPTKRARDDPGIAIDSMQVAHWIGLNCFWIINCRFDVGMPPTTREGSLLRHRLEPPAWRSSLRRRSSLLNYCNVDHGWPNRLHDDRIAFIARKIARSKFLRHIL